MPISNAFIYSILVLIECFPKDDDVKISNQAIGYLFTRGNSTPDVKIGLIADAVILFF